jgi:hypothetical protein
LNIPTQAKTALEWATRHPQFLLVNNQETGTS